MRFRMHARTLLLAATLVGTVVAGAPVPSIRASGAGPAQATVAGATPTPVLTPDSTPSPVLTASPVPTVTASRALAPPPAALNLYRASGFRYQDPSYVACTAASVMDILNFMALGGYGGAGFRWHVSLASSTRDAVLAWERAHDTLAPTSAGSDPHGIRNALNHYGWGDATLAAGKRVYEDMAFGSFATAVRTAVRQMILTRKPVVVIGWAGRHAQMMTGYYGLVGNPFAKLANGTWANTFTIAGIYFSDPLRSDHMVNIRVSWNAFRTSPNLKLRFRAYRETDSPYDDRYTPGTVISRTEWYGRLVLVVPVR